jgi:hypothetical protein
MNLKLVATALMGFVVSASVFAQSAPTTNQAPQVAPSTTASTGQWAPGTSQPVMGKTRAQVYQELVQAEKDGELKYLNSTLYAHS